MLTYNVQFWWKEHLEGDLNEGYRRYFQKYEYIQLNRVDNRDVGFYNKNIVSCTTYYHEDFQNLILGTIFHENNHE